MLEHIINRRKIPPCFALGLIDYGQLIKIKKNGRVVGKEKIVVLTGKKKRLVS
ncbi:MAG: hypothetical protein LBI79_00775 [Nitrososphaerota archaeon]|jgi:hypothetical protein|nr:hypothetical protein [Nitrososphaerota archaeon]